MFWNVDSEARLFSYDPANGFQRSTVSTSITGQVTGLAFVVPEPSTALLVGLGLLGLAGTGAGRQRLRNAARPGSLQPSHTAHSPRIGPGLAILLPAGHPETQL